MSQNMTEAQKRILEQAYSILGEHFDNCVILVHWDMDTDTPQTGTRLVFKGGCMTALGLLEWGKDRILDSDRGQEPG